MGFFKNFDDIVIAIRGTELILLASLVVVGLHCLATYIFHFQFSQWAIGALIALVAMYLWLLYSLYKG